MASNSTHCTIHVCNSQACTVPYLFQKRPDLLMQLYDNQTIDVYIYIYIYIYIYTCELQLFYPLSHLSFSSSYPLLSILTIAGFLCAALFSFPHTHLNLLPATMTMNIDTTPCTCTNIHSKKDIYIYIYEEDMEKKKEKRRKE